MTEDQYKAGLEEMLNVLENIDMSPDKERYEYWMNYGLSMIQQALDKLENKQVLH